MQLDISGERTVEQTIRALDNLPGALAEVGYESGLLAVGRVIEKAIVQGTYFRDKTGLLRSSFKVERGRPEYHPSAIIRNSAPHSWLVNRDVRYYRRAAEDNSAECMAAFVQGVNREGGRIQSELARGGRIRARTRRAIGQGGRRRGSFIGRG